MGLPENYFKGSTEIKVGDEIDRDDLLKYFVSVRYERNDLELKCSTFRVRGDIVELMPAYEKLSQDFTSLGMKLKNCKNR